MKCSFCKQVITERQIAYQDDPADSEVQYFHDRCWLAREFGCSLDELDTVKKRVLNRPRPQLQPTPQLVHSA